MGAALAQHIITMHTRGCAVLAGQREETGRKCNAIDRERKRGSVTAHRVYEDTRMSNHSMQYICKSTHLLEPDSSSLLAEALTAEVKAVLADKTSLMRAVAATQCILSVSCTSRVCTKDTHHWREPLPYLRGRENQTASWVILAKAGECRKDGLRNARGQDEALSTESNALTGAGVAVRLADDGDDESPLSCIVPLEIRFGLARGSLRHLGHSRPVRLR